MNLTIIRGIPGSGKSTLAKEYNCFHVEADMFCMQEGKYVFNSKQHKKNHKLCLRMVRMCLRRGADCVVSNTFVRTEHMKPYIRLAKKYGAKLNVVHTMGNYKSTHNVPTEIIDKMICQTEEYRGEMYYIPKSKKFVSTV